MKTFPFILHEILSDPESQNIITWMPHGCSWRVLDKEKLAKVICPKYFSHSKFEHFTRSVNGWGFKPCTKDGRNFRSFRHPYFLRGEINLCRLIKRPTFHTNLLVETIDSEDEEKVVTIDQDETRYFNGNCYQLPRPIIPNYEMSNPGYYHMPQQQWQLQITSHVEPVASVLQSNHYLFHYGYVPYHSYANPNIPPNIDQRTHPPLFVPFVQGYSYQYPVARFSTSNSAALPCSWNPLAQQQHHQYLLDWCEQLQQEGEPSTRYDINPCRKKSLSLRDNSLPRCKSCERPCRSHGTDASTPVQTLMHMIGPSPLLPTSSYFHSQPCTHQSQYQLHSKDMNYNCKTARLSRPQPVPSQSRLSVSSGRSFATASSQPMDNARLHVSHPMSMQEIVLGGDGDKDHMNAAITQECKYRTTDTKSLHSTTSGDINVMAKPMAQSIETQRGEALQLRSSMSEDKIQSANQRTLLVSIDMHKSYHAFDPRTAEIQENSSHARPQNRFLLHPRPFPIPMANPRDDGQSTSTLGLDKTTSPSKSSGANSFTFTKPQTLAHGLAVQEGVGRSEEEEDDVNKDEDKSERNPAEKPKKNHLPDQMSLPEGNNGNEYSDHLGVEVERELDHCRTHGDNTTMSFETCDEGVWLSNEKKRGRNPTDTSSLHDADGHATKVRKISPDTQSNEVNHPQLNSLHYLDDCESSMAHAHIGYSGKTPGAMDQMEPSNCGISVPLMRQCDKDNKGKVQENGQGQMIESEEMCQFKPYLHTDHSRHSENVHFGFEDVDMEPYTQLFSLSFSPFDENNSP